MTIGKEAMKKLRHFCVDTEVRPNDVVEAMILREDFDENGEDLLVFIENTQRNDIGDRDESRPKNGDYLGLFKASGILGRSRATLGQGSG